MSPGEIYLANFPFGGSPGMKLRPVLLLTNPVGPVPELVTAYISSVIPPSLLPSDLVIDPIRPEYATTHLKATSVIRLHKLASLHSHTFARSLGKISPATALEIEQRLRTLLNL
jgi:mRNA interferase MazF